jgi:hypothetical protein
MLQDYYSYGRLIDGCFSLPYSFLLIADAGTDSFTYGMGQGLGTVTVNVFHFPPHLWNVKEERNGSVELCCIVGHVM